MASPPKEPGALLHAPISKNLTDERGYHVCLHLATRTELLPRGFTHHSALRCALCGAFIRWMPKPETIERRRRIGFKLAKLSMCSGLSSWERSFVHDVSRLRKFSPRQEALVERLVRQYLEGATS
jgi:hypothetical protein